MKKFLKFVLGVAAVAGSVAGVLYWWDKRNKDQDEEDFDDEDFDDIFETEASKENDRDYVTLHMDEEEKSADETDEAEKN